MKFGMRMRKAAVLLLTFALVVTSLPVTMMTAYGASGPADGQVEYVGGGNKATGNYYIETSKKMKAVDGKENYFDITLQTKTKRHTLEMSTDVVVVMDISNTMNADRYGNYNASNANKKLTQAKAATNAFVDSFAKNANLDTNRKLAVVTFNSDAAVASPLREANDTTDANTIKAAVNKITAPGFSSTRRFTNVEAGLKLAQNILTKNSTARFKYIILMTDGFPTTYIESGSNSTTSITGYHTIMSGAYDANKAKNETLGYFANTRTKEACTGGTSYSNRAAERAQAVAKDIHAKGINVFSVGIALTSQNINDFASFIIDTTGMTASEKYVIGTTEKTYKNWLENVVAGGPLLTNSQKRYSDAYNLAQLNQDFAEILIDIERAPEVSNRAFYTTDPMSEVADFIGFYNKDGKLVGDTLTGQSKLNAEDTAVYGKAYGGQANTNAIYWDKMKSGYTKDSDGYLIYDITYRVRLKNENSGFQWATALEMNDTTTLHYTQVYSESGTPVPGGSGEVEYKIPKAEGYKGSLKLKKVDGANDESLAGAEFILRHHGTSCSVCEGDAVIQDRTVTSDANGKVSFDNIPSGHEYILIEKTPPTGYAPIHNHEIIVSYGDTYVGKVAEDHKLVNGQLNGAPFLVKNTMIEPVEIQLQVTKTMDDAVPTETYQFLLEGTESHEGKHHEYAENRYDSSLGKSVATFTPLIFDSVGTYEYKISEVTGKDPATVYDDTEYNVKAVVTLINGGHDYQAVVTVSDGSKTIFSDTFVSDKSVIQLVKAGEFKNVTRINGVAQLEASKQMLDENDQQVSLDDKKFTFELKDAEGNVLQTKENDTAGNVTFDAINYDTVGTYKYTISEIRGDDRSIAYDTTVYDAIVTVTAPENLKDKSAYTAKIEYQKDGTAVLDAVFVNKERKTPTLEVTGLKTLNGMPAKADLFSFQHIELDDDGNEVAGSERILKNNADGLIYFNFDDIVDKMITEYNQKHSTEGVTLHKYRLYEVKGPEEIGGEHIYYDDTYYELFLAVDAPYGIEYYTLSAYLYRIADGERTTVFYSDQSTQIKIGNDAQYDIHFDNASSVELKLDGSKQYLSDDGAPISMEVEQFAFTLQDALGTKLQTVKNKADGTFAFETMTFKNADVGAHTYVVYEDTDEAVRIPDVYYDEAVYTVSFEVKKDSNGHLSMTEPVYKKGSEAAADIAFVNQQMNDSHMQLLVEKTVNGATPDLMKKFDFQLKTVEAPAGTDVSKAPFSQIVQNVEGHASFELFEFEKLKAGHYVFEISEVIPDGATLVDGKYVYNKMTYDATVHRVEVDVQKTGALVEKSVTVNGVAAPNQIQFCVGFDNQYDPTPAKAAFEAQKVLTGRDMKAGEFTFELLDENSKVLQTKSNPDAEAGKAVTISFEDVTYEKVGKYVYTLKEKQGNLGGVKYDEKVYSVVVDVKDDHKGQLYAEVSVDAVQLEADQKMGDVVVFENAYQTKHTFVQLIGKKILEGKELNRNDFTFELYQVDGETKTLLQSIKNGSVEVNDKSTIAFELLEFDKPGTYQYEIKEVLGNAEGVTYDTGIYNVTVTVTDDGKGALHAATSCKKDGAQAMEILFKNIYQVETEGGDDKDPGETPTPDGNKDPAYDAENSNGDAAKPTNPNDELDTAGSKDSGETPDTGDYSNMMLWLMVLTVSCTSAVSAVVYKRKKADK